MNAVCPLNTAIFKHFTIHINRRSVPHYRRTVPNLVDFADKWIFQKRLQISAKATLVFARNRRKLPKKRRTVP